MVRTLGILFGFAFLLGGVLGFVPGVTQDGMYFGIFMVNTPHNILHIASGTIFIMASAAGAGLARLWFQIFGAFYAAIAVIGLMVGEGLIFGLISNNLYDAWGHAALALSMLLIGFAIPKQTAADGKFGFRMKGSQPPA
jgi:Domain of unknown function (DUF4383)